jgi:hypothetical protein
LLVRALPDVPWTECGASCVRLAGPRICGRVGATCDVPVKALFPQGRERFELGSAGWSPVLGSDAVGGPPHCNVADEGGAQVASRWCPDWLCVTLAGVALELVGEVGDKLGSLCQVVAPDWIGMERCWNARKPGVGSEGLFGCDVETVGVALDRLEKPGRWIVELPQHGAGGERRFIAGEDLAAASRSGCAVRSRRVG